MRKNHLYEVNPAEIALAMREQVKNNLLIGIEETCQLLCCSRSTLYRVVKTGRLSYYKRSRGRAGKVFFRLADVEAYIDKIKCTGEL